MNQSSHQKGELSYKLNLNSSCCCVTSDPRSSVASIECQVATENSQQVCKTGGRAKNSLAVGKINDLVDSCAATTVDSWAAKICVSCKSNCRPALGRIRRP